MGPVGYETNFNLNFDTSLILLMLIDLHIHREFNKIFFAKILIYNNLIHRVSL